MGMTVSAALLLWPAIAALFYMAMGRERGIIWSVPIGWLFLPVSEGFNLPVLPNYGKSMAILVGILIALFFSSSHTDTRENPTALRRVTNALVVIALVSFFLPFGTWLTNGETLANGGLIRPGLSFSDALNPAIENLFFFVPLVVAMRILSRPEHLRDLLCAFAVLGVIYTFPILFELRMSPQLHTWVYGYFQHSWIQHVRGGGFRPIVFLSHGLVVGFFIFMASASAILMFRESRKVGWLLVGLGLIAVLIATRNVGAALIGLALVPLILFTTRRLQVKIGLIVMMIFVTYPITRDTVTTPLVSVLRVMPFVSEERLGSFVFRLENEAILLERAQQKPLFGWGGYSRARVFDDAGNDLSTIDGDWIITMGKEGWIGFLSKYSFVVLVMFIAWRHVQKHPSTTMAGFILILAGMLAYNIPNAVWPVPLTLGMGMVLGQCIREQSSELDENPRTDNDSDPRARVSSYTRFGGEQPGKRLSRRPSRPTSRFPPSSE